jgi:hypothetical protein
VALLRVPFKFFIDVERDIGGNPVVHALTANVVVARGTGPARTILLLIADWTIIWSVGYFEQESWCLPSWCRRWYAIQEIRWRHPVEVKVNFGILLIIFMSNYIHGVVESLEHGPNVDLLLLRENTRQFNKFGEDSLG